MKTVVLIIAGVMIAQHPPARKFIADYMRQGADIIYTEPSFEQQLQQKIEKQWDNWSRPTN